MLKQAFKKTIKHSIIFGIGRLASRIVGLILIPIYTRFLLPSDYGVLAIIAMVGSIIIICLEMGLNTAIFRYYFIYTEENKRKQVISNVFFWLLAGGMILTIILVMSAEFVSSIFLQTSIYAPYLILIYLTMYLRALKNVSLAAMRAREKSVLFSFLSIIDLVLGLVLSIYFVVVLKRQVQGILEAGLIVGLITTPIFLIFIRKDLRLCISLKLLKRLLKFGIPLVPANLASMILTFSSRYFLTAFASLEQVGLYTLGQKIAIIISVLIVQPFQLIWPTMMFSISDKPEAQEYYSRILIYFLITVGSIALVFSVFSKEITSLIAAPSYINAYRVIPFIAFSHVAYGVYFVTTVGVNLKEKTYYLPWIVGCAAGSNLILNYLLIPQYGMMGAAVATFISYIILVIINYLINQRFYSIKYHGKKILMLGFIYCVTLALFSYDVITDIGIKIAFVAGYFCFIWFVLFDQKEKEGLLEMINFLKYRKTGRS